MDGAMLFKHCPACGKRFHVKFVGKKVLRDTTDTMIQKVRAESNVMVGSPRNPSPQVLYVDVPVVIETEDLEYTFKCGHCGHIWIEARREESEVKK